jgi:hypothetical protein
MLCQQQDDWDLFMIWAHLFKQALQHNQFVQRNVHVKLPLDDGHELNSQLLPQQECLDLQMPEKLDPSFEYHQT